MSHLHIPDGVLPVWLWLSGWVVALALVWAAGRATDASRERRKVPLLAVVSAIMLVSMSSEIVPIAYHVNLTVVGGALIGPALSPVAAFIVVLVLALLGHGGLTVIGLNTLVIASEMVLGWMIFRTVSRFLGRERTPAAAGVSTVSTLMLTSLLLIAIVAAGGSGAAQRETGALDPATLRFDSPFSAGFFSQGLFSGGEADEDAPGEGGATGEEDGGGLSVTRFATMVYVLGPIGWLLEAFVTALVLGYIARVRPSLLFGGAAPERRPPGHETGGH